MNHKPISLIRASLMTCYMLVVQDTAYAQAYVATQDFRLQPGSSFNIHGQVVWNPRSPWHRVQIWDSTGGMIELPKLPGTENYYAHAYAINDSGVVVGFNQASNALIPFAWSQAAGLQDLSSTVGGFVPVSINNHGQMVGNIGAWPASRASCLWDPVQGLQMLPVSNVIAINDSGVIVGNDARGPRGDYYPYLWTASGGIQWLLPLTGPGGYVCGINNAGQVIGGAADIGAFIWDQASGFRALNAIVTMPDGASLMSLYAINNLGQIIADGTAPFVENSRVGYVLTPIVVPEPAEWTAMVAVGALGFAIHRRLKHNRRVA